ncbi:MAG TPA: Hsp70 family protein [Kofleriaceae bacterium]|nr:Hsp70 family protein [Kofleriaceae bacterium]
MPARYLIGIDLGTTNSAVAYVDTHAADPRIKVFDVPQLVAPGEVAPRRQLPSFLYLAGEHDLAAAELALPWRPAPGPGREVVGELARNQGARNPARMIASAKSWLCHPGVDRKAAILPWGESEGPKRSPVAASSLILAHVRDAWDHVMSGEPDSAFIDQDVVVTCPASFDEAARELTHDAAVAVGLTGVVLLEEPQAAFYAWLDQRGRARARQELQPGETVLVFDVGGGTTDFTLITVEEDGGFARIAVGDHLLLGGDNVDLTLAKLVEQRLTGDGKKLDALQWHGLTHACRLAKETLLGDAPPAEVPITVAGRGSRLIAGTLRDRITRAELEQVLFDGFFPAVARDAPLRRGRGGLQEMGLPYAADPAVTRHLASFLGRHGVERVDAVLFNGGAMTPASLRGRVLDQLAAWQPAAGRPRELPVQAPELAVAVGAAYYGLVRRGLAARIRGGTPRAFYLGVETPGAPMAVCLAGKGLDDGATARLARDFELVTNRPVRFRLYSSSSRADAQGALVPIGDGRADTLDDGSDLLELPPIVAALRARGKSSVTVQLQVTITELGAVEIWCEERPGTAGGDPPGRWRLTFDMRSGGAAPEDTAAAPPHPRLPEARARVQAAFRGDASLLAPLTRELEELVEARRDEWTLSTARGLFDALIEVADARKRSADHEQRWLGLAGLCLRPGTGAPLDQWRARQMWGVFNEGLSFGKTEASRLAWWIVWRRVSGGLVATQQEQIYDRLGTLLLPNPRQQKKLAEVKASRQELGEMWRAVASLERISVGAKIKLGDELMRRLDDRKAREDAVHLWSLGRLGARAPLYGPLNTVVPASKAAAWLEKLLGWSWPEPDKLGFALAQLGRRTGDRSRDLDDGLRARLVAHLRTLPGGDRAAVLVDQVVALEAREERVAFGDTLPAGLRLMAEPTADAAEPS